MVTLGDSARASFEAGWPSDGLRPLDTAIEILGHGTGASILPELHVLKGDLLAATRLARLQVGRGEPEAAAHTLRPIYEWFTEGRNTADLLEARELLAGLGGEV